MLGISQSYGVFIQRAYKNIFLCFFVALSLSLFAEEQREPIVPCPETASAWVQRYFNSVDDNTPVDEVVDFVLCFKTYLQMQGYDMPILSSFSLEMRSRLDELGIEIEDEAFAEIYDLIVQRETMLQSTCHYAVDTSSDRHIVLAKKKRSKNKGIPISGNFAIGFCQFLAGALCCVIPTPATIAIGSGLVVAGVHEMVKHAGDAPDPDSDLSVEEILRRHPRKL